MNAHTEEDPVLLWEREGPIVVLTLNRPKTRNMISGELTDALVQACGRIAADVSIKCAILTAAGHVFCAGGNLKAMHAREHHFAGSPAENRVYYDSGVQRLARAFSALDVPVVAAVNGAAVGAGLDLVLLCDVRIAVDTTVFAESFIRLGLVSAAGGSWLLQRHVGPAAAAELTLTGDDFDARRALQLGVVSQVVSVEQLLPRAREIAQRIARHPAHAIRLNKRLLRESQTQSLEGTLTLAASMQGLAQHTADHREAVAAALEQRAPNYVDK
ncbi:enoyl-CoA hydratase-related protein [Hydrogenophaga sp. BPS33]|uniref:enoyl-CoA hydratase-related protein n=1 Tax=Hydrogenophaga sp. BPS33 TaxID=2651974 RepID=UPI00131F91ED|nr:enoyl-CoA hydratase-related protein [Hydrogenophaga sp. BPS33]QHE84602.1 enoyl-CoA hydratase [Hydrogenophaga sp. BPS33]